MRLDSIPWTPIVFLAGLLVSGIGLLIRLSGRQDRGDLRLANVEKDVNEVKGDVKSVANHVQEIRITLAGMQGMKPDPKDHSPA